MNVSWEAVLVSAPAALFLVVGIIIARKYLRSSCPSKPVLDQFTTVHAESIKSLCVSIDKQGEAIKESAKMNHDAVLRLAEAFLDRKERVEGDKPW